MEDLWDSPGPPVEVRRSPRRRSSVSARWEDGVMVLSVPASMSQERVDFWRREMARRLEEKLKPPPRGGDLMERARTLSRLYLEGKAEPVGVTWVTNQNTRWGSATPARRTIRLSHRLRAMPGWVVDYVLLHELAHLIEPNHGKRFWALVDRYPAAGRARGFLEGFTFAQRLPGGDGCRS